MAENRALERATKYDDARNDRRYHYGRDFKNVLALI